MSSKKKTKKTTKTKVTNIEYQGEVLNHRPKQNPKKSKTTPKKGSYAKNDAFPALNSKRQVFARREAMEGDYYHLLNAEEKAWMNAFLSETVVTNFYHGGPELYTAVEDKRAFYRENNYRNKDAINQAKAHGLLINVTDIVGTLDRDALEYPSDVEDSWITAIVVKSNGTLEEALVIKPSDLKDRKAKKVP